MEDEKRKPTGGLFFPALFVIILWMIKLAESFFMMDFARLGILPRTIEGFPGIFTAPLIHGDLNHLYSNTLPLLILGIIIFYFYRRVAFHLFFWIYFATGLAVWIAASGEGYHIGASGLIYGFVSFLFFSGIFRKDRKSMALSLLVTFVYGSMVWGIFPLNSSISWETHFFGALAGCFCAWYYRKSGKIAEEGDEEDENDGEDPGESEENPETLHYYFDPETGKLLPVKGRNTPGQRVYRYVFRNNQGNSGEQQGQ